MHRLLPRPQHPRRGVTLVEMLVVVALLVLMMTIIVSIFGAATGAVSVSKAYQELDDELRRIDSTLRQDLIGSTARMNPPIDPDENLGYFEYIENSFADAQGEDSDDCLRFTVHAPPGQPFTGRFYVNNNAFNVATPNLYNTTQPITITSEYAEIIYFLRHGNLYRRVLLIVPELQSVVNTAVVGSPAVPISNFYTGMFGMFGATLPSVSWQGVNDISAHPSPVSSPSGIALPPVLNTLGSLTNRENRAFSPRFGNDYDKNGIPDDYNVDINGNVNGDGVPDYYPTLYPGLFSATGSFTFTGGLLYNEFGGTRTLTSGAVNPYSIFPFPYIYPGAYSKSDSYRLNTNLGLIHSIDPTNTASVINTFNHAPLDVGDSLAVPSAANANQFQTWWGFPTWHETMSPFWLDPVWQVNMNLNQTVGLQPFSPTANPPANNGNLLPPVLLQLFNDGAGSNSSFNGVYAAPFNQAIWEDDLLMTGVRSFDVKGYDPGLSNYIDLGYSGGATGAPPAFISGFANLAQAISYLPTLQHEGRIPPIPADFRFDPQAKAKGIFNNVGDGQTSVIRLIRTWDSWSTAYTEAPANGYDPTAPNPPYGPNYYAPGSPMANPVYPSYPPPYEVPLRGLQIQVRVVDPRNERIKVLTIRHDFTDKIYKKR